MGGVYIELSTMKVQHLLGLLVLATAIVAKPNNIKTNNELTCIICVDLVTDIDEWITSDKTEQEILDFFNQICDLADQLLPGIGATCTDFLYNNGPGIINSLVKKPQSSGCLQVTWQLPINLCSQCDVRLLMVTIPSYLKWAQHYVSNISKLCIL